MWLIKDSPQQYVDYQTFGSTGITPPHYYEGDDYDSPTGVTLMTQIQFPGGGKQYDWITTFGNVSTLTKTYSGSLTFGTCVVNVSWTMLGLGQPEDQQDAMDESLVGGSKGPARLVQPELTGFERIQSLLEQAQDRVAGWLFRSWQRGSQTGLKDPGMVLTNPPSGNIWRSYYYAGGQRVAMRVQDSFGNNSRYLLMGDHLGSTSVSYDVSSQTATIERYLPWGGLRDGTNSLPTNYTYTGQYSYTADFGLMFYGSRFYDPSLGRFAQADNIITGIIPAVFDRYTAMLNNPMNLVDPSGHTAVPHPVPGCTIYDADGYCVQGGVGNGWDSVPLSHHGDTRTTADGKTSKTDVGGADLYQLFLKYRNICGWWNNYMCGENSTFGLEEFLGLWIFMESGYSNPDAADVIAVIVAQNLYNGGWNPAVCEDGGACFNAVLNFMGSYTRGTGGIFAGPAYAATLVTRGRADY